MNAGRARSDSVVTERATPAGPVIEKRHRTEADRTRSPAVRARHEFEILTLLHQTMPDAFTVPRAIELDEESGTVVMERAAGTALDALIRERKRLSDGAEALAPSIAAAGAWLRVMQQVTVHAGANGRNVLRAQVALAERDAQEVYRGTRQRRVREGLAAFERRVASRDLIVCGHHGDYWPGNVFLAAGCVSVIDFEGYRDGLPAEDVAYFLLQLQLLLPRHAAQLPRLRRAFFEGFGQDVDDDSLRLFTLTKTLRLLARNAGSQHSLLIRLWIRRTLRRNVEQCLP